MNAHDCKLDRAGTERIVLMEVCPVCGEQRRNSARFCTTCGHRFATDEITNTPVPPATTGVTLDPHDGADPVISGWPAPSSPVAASPWAPAAEEVGSWPLPPAPSQAESDATDVTWAEVAAKAFVAPRPSQPNPVLTAEMETVDEFEAIDLNLEASEGGTRSDDLLRQRARSLLNELQEVIEGLTGDSSSGSSDLAGELEISLTRPAGLDGEALADLRTTAESAKVRPRDLDTLTALTAQADTILALVVGYERATAGIERAIETLQSRRGNTEI
jgi:hypothetical protein